MYYERRLLSVAYNRMDRYISIRHKGLGASKVNDKDIVRYDQNDFLYLVKSNHSDRDYIPYFLDYYAPLFSSCPRIDRAAQR